MSSPNMQKLKAKWDKLQPRAFMTELFMGVNRKQRRMKNPDLPEFTKKRTEGRRYRRVLKHATKPTILEGTNKERFMARREARKLAKEAK